MPQMHSYFESHTFDNSPLPFYANTRTVTSLISVSNWHPNIEFIYCLSGKGIINCDGIVYNLNPGDLFVIQPNSLHAVHAHAPLTYCYLIVSNHFCEENSIFPTEISFQQHISEPSFSRLFEQVISTFSNEYSNDSIRIAKIRHAVLGFLIALHENYILDYHRSLEHPLAIKRIMEATLFIHQNIAQPLSVDEIASHLGICRSHLSREFHKITGMTIIEYINVLRCKEAKRYISEGNGVAAAAIAVGFNNLSYFTRTYKKYIGELPSENKKGLSH